MPETTTMSTEVDLSTAEKVRVFLRQKLPVYLEKNIEFKIFSSAVLLYMEHQEREMASLKQELKERIVPALQILGDYALSNVAAPGEAVAGGAAAVPEGEDPDVMPDGRPRDKTPFPAGFSPAPGGSAASAAAAGAAGTEVVDEDEVIDYKNVKPDVVGVVTAVNGKAPVPAPAPAPSNGSSQPKA